MLASRVEATLAARATRCGGPEPPDGRRPGRRDLIVADVGEVDPGRRRWATAFPCSAFYRHTDPETRRRAEAAGVDLVVPRSRLAREMPELVDRLLSATRPRREVGRVRSLGRAMVDDAVGDLPARPLISGRRAKAPGPAGTRWRRSSARARRAARRGRAARSAASRSSGARLGIAAWRRDSPRAVASDGPRGRALDRRCASLAVVHRTSSG